MLLETLNDDTFDVDKLIKSSLSPHNRNHMLINSGLTNSNSDLDTLAKSTAQ